MNHHVAGCLNKQMFAKVLAATTMYGNYARAVGIWACFGVILSPCDKNKAIMR